MSSDDESALAPPTAKPETNPAVTEGDGIDAEQKRKAQIEEKTVLKPWRAVKAIDMYRDSRFLRESSGPKCAQRPAKRMRITITLHEDHYQAKPVIITEGPLKGKRVFILEQMRYNLMSLSPELRLMIFSHLLVQKDKIIIGRSHKSVAGRTHTLVNGTPRLQRTWRPKAQKPSHFRLFGFNLLLVNKKIHQEAAELIYGKNHFEVRGIQAAMQFMEEIGNMAHFLRHIILPYLCDDCISKPEYANSRRLMQRGRAWYCRQNLRCARRLSQSKQVEAALALHINSTWNDL